MDAGSLQSSYPAQFGRFVLSWINDPRAVGAVAPSGRALGKLMVSEIRPGARVMELGPGTGTVTRAILDRGVAVRDLYLLERCPRFTPTLRREFSGATVIEGDATIRHDVLDEIRGSVDFVISGLPLVLFSSAQKRALLQRCFELLTPTGALYQFTYGIRCPLRRRLLAELGLRASRIGIAALNVPPAFVYRVDRG